MKREKRIFLSMILVLVLAVCAGGTIANAASASDTEEWDSETELQYIYEPGKMILLETDDVRIYATYMMYINSSDRWMLYLTAGVENLTDEEIRVRVFADDNDYNRENSFSDTTIAGKEAKGIVISFPDLDWNCLIGETEDCFQGYYRLEVDNGTGQKTTALYEVYASRTAPFANVAIEGEADAHERLTSFAFPVSDDIAAFMEGYGLTDPAVWNEPKLEFSDDILTIAGTLTPDHEGFIDFDATISSYNWRRDKDISEEELTEHLLALYQEISGKAGLVFEGAEDSINEVYSLENTWYEPVRFYCEDYVLNMISNDTEKGFSISRKYREYGELPFTPADVLAYLEADDEKDITYERAVYYGEGPYGMDARPYAVSLKLDENEHIVEADAQYAEDDMEEARAYFEGFASLLLKDEAYDKLMKFIENCCSDMDSEDRNAWSDQIGRDYSINMVLSPSYSHLEIRINPDVPEDAPPFPNEEEQEALLLDPVARLGIDKDIEVPETVLFTKDDISIVLEKALYTEDELCLVIRMENVPENVGIEVELNELNGSAVSEWPYESGSMLRANIYSGDDHEQTERKSIYGKASYILKNIPDFTGISSLSLSTIYYEKADSEDGSEDVYIYGDPVSIETGY